MVINSDLPLACLLAAPCWAQSSFASVELLTGAICPSKGAKASLAAYKLFPALQHWLFSKQWRHLLRPLEKGAKFLVMCIAKGFGIKVDL